MDTPPENDDSLVPTMAEELFWSQDEPPCKHSLPWKAQSQIPAVHQAKVAHSKYARAARFSHKHSYSDPTFFLEVDPNPHSAAEEHLLDIQDDDNEETDFDQAFDEAINHATQARNDNGETTSAIQRLLNETSQQSGEAHVTEWMNAACLVAGAVEQAIEREHSDDEPKTRNINTYQKRGSESFSAMELDMLQKMYPPVRQEREDSSSFSLTSSSEDDDELEVFTTPAKENDNNIQDTLHPSSPVEFYSPRSVIDKSISLLSSSSSSSTCSFNQTVSAGNESDDFDEVLDDIIPPLRILTLNDTDLEKQSCGDRVSTADQNSIQVSPKSLVKSDISIIVTEHIEPNESEPEEEEENLPANSPLAKSSPGSQYVIKDHSKNLSVLAIKNEDGEVKILERNMSAPRVSPTSAFSKDTQFHDGNVSSPRFREEIDPGPKLSPLAEPDSRVLFNIPEHVPSPVRNNSKVEENEWIYENRTTTESTSMPYISQPFDLSEWLDSSEVIDQQEGTNEDQNRSQNHHPTSRKSRSSSISSGEREESRGYNRSRESSLSIESGSESFSFVTDKSRRRSISRSESNESTNYGEARKSSESESESFSQITSTPKTESIQSETNTEMETTSSSSGEMEAEECMENIHVDQIPLPEGTPPLKNQLPWYKKSALDPEAPSFVPVMSSPIAQIPTEANNNTCIVTTDVPMYHFAPVTEEVCEKSQANTVVDEFRKKVAAQLAAENEAIKSVSPSQLIDVTEKNSVDCGDVPNGVPNEVPQVLEDVHKNFECVLIVKENMPKVHAYGTKFDVCKVQTDVPQVTKDVPKIHDDIPRRTNDDVRSATSKSVEALAPNTIEESTKATFNTQDSIASSSTGSIDEPRPLRTAAENVKMYAGKWNLSQLSMESEEGGDRTLVHRQSAVSLDDIDVADTKTPEPPCCTAVETGNTNDNRPFRIGLEEEEALCVLDSHIPDPQLQRFFLPQEEEVRSVETSNVEEKCELSVEGVHPSEVERLRKQHPEMFDVPSGDVDNCSNDNIVDGEQRVAHMVTDIDACLTEDSMENVADNKEVHTMDSDNSIESFPLAFTVPDRDDAKQTSEVTHDRSMGTHTAFHLFDYSFHPPSDAAGEFDDDDFEVNDEDTSDLIQDPMIMASKQMEQEDDAYMNPSFINDNNVTGNTHTVVISQPIREQSSAFMFENPAFESNDEDVGDVDNSITEPHVEPTANLATATYVDTLNESVEAYISMVVQSAVKEVKENPSRKGSFRSNVVNPEGSKASCSKCRAGSAKSRKSGKEAPGATAQQPQRQPANDQKNCCDSCIII